MPLVLLRGATVLRDGAAALNAIDLAIGAGEHTAILGPNGSGKSTLIQLLTCRLYPVAQANRPPPVLIFGRQRWNVMELRSRLGVVSPEQERRLLAADPAGAATARDVVTGSFFASDTIFFHHRVSLEMRERAEAALLRAGAGALANRPLRSLSTGEARRVLIARALVHEPEMLLLDEPTTGLDVVARAEFLAEIRELAGAGCTIVVVTHDVEEVLPAVRQVILLGQGSVVAAGPTNQVLADEPLSRAFGAPLRLHREDGRYRLVPTLAAPAAHSPDASPSVSP